MAASSRVGVVFYPEGQGHATRMLGVAQALERRGATVEFAGGGPGTEFVELRGYDVYRATDVDFIGDYQYRSPAILAVLTRSVPCSYRRVRDLVGWIRRRDPDVLVTDDMFAVLAASVTRTPFHVVSHNAASLYEALVERFTTWGMNRYQQATGEAFHYPAVWPETADDPGRARRVPPIACEAPADQDPPGAVDVLLVPSAYSEGVDDLAARLEAAGRSVTRVGGQGWEPVPSLLPWMRAATVVVCSGYSSVMEAAVAGTPCVVWPFTDEQRGVARKLSTTDVAGFHVAETPTRVVSAVADPGTAPEHVNGTDAVAEAVLGGDGALVGADQAVEAGAD